MKYTIETKKDSAGNDLYKIVPAMKIRMYPLGWFSSEAEAITAFQEWLTHNPQ